MIQELTVEKIAKICHQANKAYCEALGDTSQPDWESAPEWQRDSAIKGVWYNIERPQSTPEESHGNWLATKIQEGWVHGPVKDVERKQHPCCLPYDQLPAAQKAKDYLFIAIVRSLVLCRADRDI